MATAVPCAACKAAFVAGALLDEVTAALLHAGTSLPQDAWGSALGRIVAQLLASPAALQDADAPPGAVRSLDHPAAATTILCSPRRAAGAPHYQALARHLGGHDGCGAHSSAAPSRAPRLAALASALRSFISHPLGEQLWALLAYEAYALPPSPSLAQGPSAAPPSPLDNDPPLLSAFLAGCERLFWEDVDAGSRAYGALYASLRRGGGGCWGSVARLASRGQASELLHRVACFGLWYCPGFAAGPSDGTPSEGGGGSGGGSSAPAQSSVALPAAAAAAEVPSLVSALAGLTAASNAVLAARAAARSSSAHPTVQLLPQLPPPSSSELAAASSLLVQELCALLRALHCEPVLVAYLGAIGAGMGQLMPDVRAAGGASAVSAPQSLTTAAATSLSSSLAALEYDAAVAAGALTATAARDGLRDAARHRGARHFATSSDEGASSEEGSALLQQPPVLLQEQRQGIASPRAHPASPLLPPLDAASAGRLLSALLPLSLPGGPLYPTRPVRRAAEAALDALFPSSALTRWAVLLAFRALHPCVWPRSLAAWAARRWCGGGRRLPRGSEDTSSDSKEE